MNKVLASILIVGICVGVVLAASPQPSREPAVVSTIKQLEQEMGEAMIRSDVERLSQIYADDFATITTSGKVLTKKDILADFASFRDKLESFETGPMDVQVFGDVAVVQGSVAEKRIKDGQATSAEYVWMDLLERRAGQWVVVRSEGAKLKPLHIPL